MSDKFVMSSRQSAELDHAFERNGWSSADVKLLSCGNALAQFLPVLRGQAEITVVKHIIDCDADPMIPYEDWRVGEHTKRGQVNWDPSQFKLHLSSNQQGGKIIQGNKLRKELESLPTENVNLLDYLLEHPHLIPEEWKRGENGKIRHVFFWSTIYRNSGGCLCVRYLRFLEGRWQAYYSWLGSDFGDGAPSLVRAS